MLTFSDTEKQISLLEITEVEEFAELNFPDEYKAHLLEYNGGQCSPSNFSFNENGKITDSCIDWFMAIYDGENDNLREAIETYKIEEKRMPTHILPIANDPFGNIICISCGLKDFGAIYFWDHENEVDYSIEDDHNFSNLYFVSNSLTEFLNSLSPNPSSSGDAAVT